MRIGLQIPRFTWPDGAPGMRSTLAEIAGLAEDAGFYSIWVMDHFFQIPGVGEVDEPMLEGYTVLSFLAAATSKLKLGTLVSGVIYRPPALLLKQATTLDVLSGGRSYLGVGAGWFEREALGLGFGFPSMKERFERLEEMLQIARQIWADDATPYAGRHYHWAEPIWRPRPLSRPHPPILIGGMGERKTLKLVAKYADACNLFARSGTEVLRHKLDILQNHCQQLGRDYDSIEKTVLGTVMLDPGSMTASDVINQCRELAGLGIDQAIFNMPNVHTLDPLRQFGDEIIPEVAGL
jgi:F420-dependent oxidoreductase-like protein